MTDSVTMYRIETKGRREWEPVPNSDTTSRGEAEALIAALRELDDEWAKGEYRIVEVDPPA